MNYDSAVWRDFLGRHQLNQTYLENAHRCFLSLIKYLHLRGHESSEPVLVALNGCQGSGKSTLADYLATYLRHVFGDTVEVMSLDDFYFSHEVRQQLARDIHPLLATRGVPGTHDIAFLNETFDRLVDKDKVSGTLIPRFDKSIDDRKPKVDWPVADQRPNIILLEGWCLGAEPIETAKLFDPINDLERIEDADVSWRSYVNQQLGSHYVPIFSRFHIWIMLRAPSFESVFSWRLEQETKLVLRKTDERISLMSREQLLRFIQHYERITLNCLANLPEKVNFLYNLDENRNVVETRFAETNGMDSVIV